LFNTFVNIFLHMGTKLIGNKIIHLDSVASTNDYLNNLLTTCLLNEGTIVITDNQLAGKGLDKNTWESKKGENLTLSIFLRPSFLPIEKQFMLNKVISLAVCNFIELQLPGENIKIKWPNDIYIGNQKAAGILINNSLQGSKFVFSIVGIGLNVNQTIFLSDAPNPVSISMKKGKSLNLNDCLLQLCNCIDIFYNRLQTDTWKTIDNEYLSHLFQYQLLKTYYYKGKIIQATITGISSFGKLQLAVASGDKIECDLKEITFIVH